MAPPGIKYSQEPPDIENVLALNPRVNTSASLRPTAITKADKLNWKRNTDKGCSVSFTLETLKSGMDSHLDKKFEASEVVGASEWNTGVLE